LPNYNVYLQNINLTEKLRKFLTHKIYKIQTRGSSRERGKQHGQLLADPINKAIQFYQQMFQQHLKIGIKEIRQRSKKYFDPLSESFPDVFKEMEGIAEGSKQQLHDILMLSARWEITFEHLKVGECSNLFVGSDRSKNGETFLGMNWEWRPEVMDFRAVITAYCDDQPDSIVVTECGQPGKFGINEFGIAVIETGLACSKSRSIGKVPFAPLICQALRCKSLESARNTIHQYPPEATINFILADEHSNGWCIEATPTGLYEHNLQPSDLYWHTNHSRLTKERCEFDDSLLRGARWEELLKNIKLANRKQVESWLADTKNGSNAICKAPDITLANKATWLQTLCSAVINTKLKEIWVSDGPSFKHPYERIYFE
tara:strand:- start:3233 stop:4351 length:1119 start_codon:yes stop_codon:yes gene_type:complete